jgi:hypothetical protein
MTDTVVKHYRVLCIEENKMVTVYGLEPPTLCPNDHADRTIDHSRTIKSGQYSHKTVELQSGTPGNFQYTTIHFTIPAGTPGDVTDHDFSWPMDLMIWRTEFVPGTEHVGDMSSTIISPDQIIGILSADANIGDTELTINSEAFGFPNLTKGIEVMLDDTSNAENLGRIVGIDKVYFKIHVETPLTQNFAAGTNLCLNICIVKDIAISQSNRSIMIGAKGFSSINVPANTVIRFKYKNNDGLEKDVHIEMEYNYQ